MICNQQITLGEYLLSKNYHRNTIKKLLKYKNILVNNEVITNYNYLLNKGDQITIKKNKDTPLEIIYEDRFIVVINKPCGLVCERTPKEKEKTAYNIMKQYLNKKNEKIYLVHRLDQYTSGILMFVKDEKLYKMLTKDWNKYVKIREYAAIVEGKVDKDGTIRNYLSESKSQEVYVTSKGKGKYACTHYKVIQANSCYSLLEVMLDTGRKNQIRVHMASIGHPIAGDKKYGAKTNPIKRLALHHTHFSFENPINHRLYEFSSEVPEEFYSLVRK